MIHCEKMLLVYAKDQVKWLTPTFQATVAKLFLSGPMDL